jgi:DNA sulfur modification protein DndB
MANLLSAIKAHMGDTPYYITRVPVLQLLAMARPPRETDGWAGQSIEDRMQRKPDTVRIKRDIVPYLQQDKHRFFGAFILLVEPGTIQFESLTDLIPTLGLAYRTEGASSGFLTLESVKDSIVLDGQHRWYALRDAMKDPEKQTDDLLADEVTVLFIENVDHRKTRGIFNKINRYAKPTSRSDNIITSEDDGYFIVTRMLLDPDAEGPNGELLPGPLADYERILPGGEREDVKPVQWTSTTLSKTMNNLTTISAVSDNVKAILDYTDKISIGSEDEKRRRGAARPSRERIEQDYVTVRDWFEKLLDGIDAYKEGLADLGALADSRVDGQRVIGRRFDDNDKHTLLFRPVGQVVLGRALVAALDASRGQSAAQMPTIELGELIARVNKVDFSMPTGSMWHGTIVSNDGRMVARETATDNAAELLAYLIAPEYFNEEQRHKLWARWNRWQGRDVTTPPAELEAAGDTHLVPRPLPEPVST